MEILSAVSSHISNAKASLIRAGIEMQKVPVPIQHGCKLLRMVADLDKIQQWLGTDDADQAEASAVRGKPKASKRLKAKQRQSQPTGPTPDVLNKPVVPPAAATLPLATTPTTTNELPRGSKLIG